MAKGQNLKVFLIFSSILFTNPNPPFYLQIYIHYLPQSTTMSRSCFSGEIVVTVF